MPFSYFTWLFAGLFVLLGLPLLATETPAWGQFWAGLSTLSLGGFAVSMAADALKADEVRLQHTTVRRADKPRLFWANILMFLATGMVVLGTGVWLLLFKD